MQRPRRETVTLEDIVIAEELSRRNPRAENLLKENQALHALARQLVNQPEMMLQSLVDIAIELCIAGSAGVSLLEMTPTGEEVFRWNVLAGALEQYVGGTTPREFSPCGVCLERGNPVLFSHPERYFTYFQAANTPIVEGLVLPLIAENHALGSIWIMSHDEQRHFDSEDVRIMTSLADFAAAALLLNQRQTQELLAKNVQLEAAAAERKRAEELARESEAYFHAIADLVPDMLWRSDPTGKTGWYNQRWLEYTGQTMEEAQGYGWLEVIHPSDRAQSLANFQNALDEHRPLQQEHRIRDANGNYRWFEVRAEPVFNGDGRITQWFGAAIDIHEQRTATEQLRQSEAHLRGMIENLPGGAAFVIDRNLRYLLAEGEALHTAGFKSEDLVGKTIFEVLSPELAANYEVKYRKALAGEPFEHEHNAHDRTYVSRGTPLYSQNGEVYAVLAVSYDITDAYRQATQRKQAEATVAADLQDMQRLRELSARLVTEGDIQTLYQEIVATAIALTGADAGSIQILDEATQELVMLANQGAGQKLTEHFYRVNAGSNTPCGIALTTGKRTFVDFDVPESEDPHGSMRLHREEGYLSAQSTPLITRSGKAIGMVSTHWCKHHRPSDRELRFLDLLARQAADLIEQRQAEAALRENEAKYRSLFNSMDEAYAVVEVLADDNGEWNDFLFLEVNPAFVKQTSMEYPVGRKATELLGTPNSNWAQIYGRVAETGEPIRLEEGEATLGRVFDLYVFRLGEDGSRRVAVLFTDITDRKRAEEALRESEEQQAFLLKFSDALRAEPDADAVANRAIRMLKEQMQLDRCYIGVYRLADDRGDFTHQVGNDRLPPLPDQVRLSDFPESLRVAFDRTLVINDIAEIEGLSDTDRQNLSGLGMRALVAATLRKGENNPLWSIVSISAHPRRWTQNEIALAEEVTERTWAAMERARAEAALRESEEKYRALFNSVDDGFCIVERVEGEPIDFRYLEANPAFAVQTGISNVVGKTMREAFPDAPEAGYEIYENVLKTGEPIRFELDVSIISRVLEIYAFRIDDEPCLAVIFKDITERVRVEDDRKRREANQAFLNEVSQDLAHLTNIDETMNAIGAKIGAYFHASQCPFGEIDETQQFVTITHEWKRADSPSYMGTHRLSDFNTEDFQRTMRAGETYVLCDAANDPRANAAQTAALSIGAFISVPLVREGKWRFNLTLFDTEARDWRENEVELLSELTTRIWTRLERARAEESLLVSEQKYRSLFNSINEGYALCELLYDENETPIDWRILEVNPSFESLTGLIQAAGKSGSELDQLLNANWLQTLAPVAQTGEAIRFEQYAGGLDYWFDISVSRIDGDSHHIVIVLNNITDRKQAEAERIHRIEEQAAREEERQRAESLAELDRAKTLFFSNISHEFRTPLTLLLAPLQDALSDSVNSLAQAQRERLELVHRNTMRLLKLVNTLLDFSRIESGRMEAVYEPTDLAMFTAELASVFRSAIEQAGLRLVVDCPPMSEPVYVDREMWEKIVLNLLSNAFKFTFEGEITLRLHLADDYHVTLQVEDTGAGIEPEELPHLFERFYQVRKAKARTHEGSGIGLALVHELIKLHGGTVDVSSTVGQGSCFTVTISLGTAHLPSVSEAGRDSARRLQLNVGDRITATRTLTSTALGAAPYVQEAERWIGEESVGSVGSVNSYLSSHPSHPSLSSPSHILIVDDNADMRDYLKRILSEHVEVETVADGAAALAAVNQRVPDLVLSDVMMPGLDGFELLQALRADERTKEVPIILLSARAGEESVIEGLLAGADDYLIKPFSASELVTRVNAYLQLAHLRSETLRSERIINHRKDEVLSTVSHELNTPLVAILGWTRLLRSSPPSPAMLMKSLETIERNATLQAKLVQDLLDISRITAGKICLILEPVELQQVIDTAIATVRHSLETKDIRLDCLLDQLPVIVQGDPERLQQIILNLLTNAVKFTPEGGRIAVSLQTQENQAEISITDTGCGIDGDFLPYIFDTFRQANGVKKGLGLGLAIARSLVELHGGTIAAQSPGIGQGTTFTVRLPCP